MCKNPPKVKEAEIKKRPWDERIYNFMRQFGDDTTKERKRRELIQVVKSTATELDTDQMLYNRAWDKFKAAGFFL